MRLVSCLSKNGYTSVQLTRPKKQVGSSGHLFSECACNVVLHSATKWQAPAPLPCGKAGLRASSFVTNTAVLAWQPVHGKCQCYVNCQGACDPWVQHMPHCCQPLHLLCCRVEMKQLAAAVWTAALTSLLARAYMSSSASMQHTNACRQQPSPCPCTPDRAASALIASASKPVESRVGQTYFY